MDIPEALLKELQHYPCDTVQKQGEEIKETRELMIAIKTSLDNLTRETQELKEDVKDINKHTATTAQIEALERRVSKLEQKPARRWEDFLKYVGTTIAGAIIMYILSNAGIV